MYTTGNLFVKRVLFFSVFAMLITGGVFSQDKASNVRDNWISGEISLLGIGARYERMINKHFSVDASVFFNAFAFMDDASMRTTGVQVAGRWYPWAATFFTEIGLGFAVIEDTAVIGTTEIKESFTGVFMAPAFGWKIDVGNPGGFFVSPMLELMFVFNSHSFAVDSWTMDAKMSIGFGYAF